MIEFTDKERQYLLDQKLARVATASDKSVPDIGVVAFKYYPERGTLIFGGIVLANTIKYRNIVQNGNVCIVIDDMASISPWQPRGIKLRGKAEIVMSTPDEMMMRPDVEIIRITPDRKWVWGVNEAAISPEGFKLEQSVA